VQACWQALIDAVHQPGERVVRRLEHDLKLENVVEIDVPRPRRRILDRLNAGELAWSCLMIISVVRSSF
jgi:hypothetical protein